MKVSKGTKIRNRYNQVPHLTQDTNGKLANSQIDTTNESQERAKRSALSQQVTTKHIHKYTPTKTQQTQDRKKHKRSTKEVPPWNGK